MFHGDPAHTGEATGSTIDSTSVAEPEAAALDRRQGLDPLHARRRRRLRLRRPGQQPRGGACRTAGSSSRSSWPPATIAATFTWAINPMDRDTHGFCGMGCTPAVVNGKVYFSAFDGKLYCLDQNDFSTPLWVTDLRYADMPHNQPVTNDFPNGNGNAASASGRRRRRPAGPPRSSSTTASTSAWAKGRTPTSTASSTASTPTPAT